MKAILKSTFLIAVLTLVWGCSSDDDGNAASTHGITFAVSEKPTWEVDWLWNDEKPDWEAPDPALFEDRMYVIIQLNDEFVPYSTPDDRMALFRGDECRGVSARNVSIYGKIYFTIMVAGNSNDTEMYARMELRYYCGGMKQIFCYPGFYSFLPDAIIGDTWDQTFPFGTGGRKYPYLKQIAVQLTGSVPFVPADDDLIGAFVNGECRGTGQVGELFDVWSRENEDKVLLRYYSVEKGGVYTLEDSILVEDDYYPDLTFNF